MTETKGHFKKGLWVMDAAPAAATPDANTFDKRFSGATKAVVSSVDDMMKVTRELVTTREGKQYIEKTLKDNRMHIQKSFERIMGWVKDELDRKSGPVK